MSHRRGTNHRNKSRRQYESSARNKPGVKGPSRTSKKDLDYRARQASRVVGKIDHTQARQLSGTEVSTIRSKDVSDWSPRHIESLGERVKNLKKKAFLSLPPDAIGGLNRDQLNILTRERVQQLSTEQFLKINVSDLGPMAISYLDPDHHITQMSDDQVRNLTPEQVTRMLPEQLDKFSANKIVLLDPATLGSINPAAFTNLSAGQLAALSNSQLASISNQQIAQLNANQLTSLSVEQLNQLTPGTFAAIPPASLSQLDSAKINGLSNNLINNLTIDQVRALSQVLYPAAIPNDLDRFFRITAGQNISDIFSLLKSAENRSSLNEISDLIDRAIHHNDGTSVDEINTLFRVAPRVGNPIPDLIQILNSVGNRNNVADTATLILQARVHTNTATLTDINRLVQAAPAINDNATELTNLLTAVGNNGNLDQIIDLVNTAVQNGTVNELTALVNEAKANEQGVSMVRLKNLLDKTPDIPNRLVDLTNLIRAVQTQNELGEIGTLISRTGATGSIADLSALINAVGNRSSLGEINNTLLRHAITHDRNLSIAGLTAMVNAAPAGGNPALDLAALITRIGNNGTIAETTFLINRAIHHNPGTTIQDIEALAQAAPAAPNTAVQLANLVNTIGANSTLPDTTALVRAAIQHDGTANIQTITALAARAPAAANLSADLTTLINRIGNNGTVVQTTNLIDRARVHDANATLLQIDALVQASPNQQVVTRLTDLVNEMGNHGTIVETTNLIQRVLHHQGGTSLADIRNLVRRAPNEAQLAVNLRTLVDHVAGNGDVNQLANLFQRALHFNANTTVLNVDTLIQAAPHAPNFVDSLRHLVNRVQAQDTIVNTATLLTQARLHNAGTTIQNVADMVFRAGNHAQVSTDLTALVNAIQGNGTPAEIINLIRRSRARIGEGHTNDLLPLINRNNAQNTPNRVVALLDGLHGNNSANRRIRFNTIVPNIPLFLRRAANPNPYVALAGHNYTTFNGPVQFRIDVHRWERLAARHTYEHFNFALANHSNSMWAPGTDLRVELGPNVLAARGNGLVHGGPIVNGATGEVGVNATRYVTHFRPINANVHFNYRLNEIRAIDNLE